MSKYTARDLRVANEARLHHSPCSCCYCEAIATALAAERKRALRGMARWVRKIEPRKVMSPEASGAVAMLRMVAAEASRRARD